MVIKTNFPGFNFSPLELKKYVRAGKLFTIMLTSGELIHFIPEDGNKFKKWLAHYQIEEIPIPR